MLQYARAVDGAISGQSTEEEPFKDDVSLLLEQWKEFAGPGVEQAPEVTTKRQQEFRGSSPDDLFADDGRGAVSKSVTGRSVLIKLY